MNVVGTIFCILVSALPARADDSFSEADLREVAGPIASGVCESACETSNWSILPESLLEATAAKLSLDDTVFVLTGNSSLNCGAGSCTVAFVLRSGDQLIAIWSEAASDRFSKLQPDEIPSTAARNGLPRVSLTEFPKSTSDTVTNAGTVREEALDLTVTLNSETVRAQMDVEAGTFDVSGTLLVLMQEINDRYTNAEALSGADRANELSTIRTLLDEVENDYPASNEALSLALGEKIGSVDPAALDAELAAAETDAQKPDLTSVTTIDPTLATLSICFLPNEQPEGSDNPSARITIQVELDADGKIVGMPDFIEPATPDEAARKLFQRSLIALDSCAELKTLELPTAIEMSLTAVGVDKAVMKPSIPPAESPVLEAPPVAAENLPEVALEPVWAVAENATEKALNLERDDIAELQVRLGLLGFDPNGVDGVIGRGVRMAINDWQIARSVPPSGYLDDRQLTAMKTESQDAFSGWIAEGTNADMLAKASKAPKVESNPSTERAKTQKRPKDCISFEGVTTCL